MRHVEQTPRSPGETVPQHQATLRRLSEIKERLKEKHDKIKEMELPSETGQASSSSQGWCLAAFTCCAEDPRTVHRVEKECSTKLYAMVESLAELSSQLTGAARNPRHLS